MNFKEFVIRNRKNIKDYTTPRDLLAIYFKSVSSLDELIQYLQLNFLFSISGVKDIIKDIFNAKNVNDLPELVKKYSTIFDNEMISSHIYMYYIFSLLKIKNIQRDVEFEFFNPLIYTSTKLKDYGFDDSFGIGAFLEEDYKLTVNNNKLMKANSFQSMLTIPNGIVEVDANFLNQDNNVRFITFPSSFKKLVPKLFKDNAKIKYAIFDEHLKVMPEEAFSNATDLRFVIARGLTEIKERAFIHTNIATTNHLGVNTVEKIGDRAFYNCRNIDSIHFKQLKSIGKEAFYGCYGVKNISFGFNEQILSQYNTMNSLFGPKKDFTSSIKRIHTSFTNKVIPDNFFSDLENVESIIITGEVEKIGKYAFKNCHNLKQLELNFIGEVIDDNLFSSFPKLIKLPNFTNIKKVGNNAFANMDLSELTLSFENLVEVGDYAFRDTTLSKTLIIPEKIGKDSFIGAKGFSRLVIKNNNFHYKDENDHYLPYQLFNFKIDDFLVNHPLLKTLIVNAPLTNNYCYSWSQLENLYLNKGVKTISQNAFKNCHNLSVVKLYEKEVDILEGAFSYCGNIKAFTINDKAGKAGLLDLEGINSLGHDSFSYLKNITELNLNVSGKIGLEALKDLKELTSVTYTYSEKNEINEFYQIFTQTKEAFNVTMKNLKVINVSFPNKKVPTRFFEGLENVEIINVTDQIVEVGEYGFANLTNLTKLDIELVDSIVGDYAFYNLPKAEKLPNINRIKSIGQYSFANIDLSNSIVDLTNTEDVGDYAFNNSVLNKTLILPKVFGKDSFLNAQGFNTIEINNNDFFYNDEKDHFLLYQIFANSIKEFNLNYKDVYNIKLSGNIIKNSLKGLRYIKRVIVDGEVTKVEENAFAGCESLEVVFIKSKDFSIDTDAFSNCNNLKRVFIGESVSDVESLISLKDIKSIKSRSFSNSDLVENIIIDVNEVIEVESISNFKNLKHVEYIYRKENNINHFYEIFNESLNGFNYINKEIKELVVTFTDGIIPPNFFNNLYNIEMIKVLGDIKEVGEHAFAGCTNLEHLDINFVEALIEEGAFYNVSKLKVLNNFENVKTIEGEIFNGNNLIELLNINDIDTDISVLVNNNKNIKEINYYGKEIKKGYFKDLMHVTTISLESENIIINTGAFQNSKSLVKINNIKNAKAIYSNAFAGTSIEEIELSDDLLFLAAKAFSSMYSLKRVKMPIKFLTLGELFDFNKNDNNVLVRHQIEEDFYKRFYIPKSLEEVTLTSGTLHEGMFSDLKVEINIDFAVADIADFAFFNSSNININLNHIKTIGKSSFYNTNIDNMELFNVEKIDECAFENATINNLTIGLIINDIALNAFLNTKINNLNIKNSSYFEFNNETLVDIKNGVILYVGKNLPENYEVPTSVLHIYKDNFKDITHIKSFNTNMVKEIEDEALINLVEIEEFIIGRGMVNYGNNVLPRLNKLTKLEVNLNYNSNIKNKSLIDIFGKESLENITYLKVSGGDIGENFLKGIKSVNELDLFDLNIDTLSNDVINGMKIELISLPKDLRDVDHNLFVDSQIQQIKKDQSKHFYLEDEMIFTNDELYYFFNEEKPSLILDDSIKGIKKGALSKAVNVQKVKFNGKLELTDEFHNLLNVEEVIITGDTNYRLSDLFLESADKIKKVIYEGSIVKKRMFANLPNLEFVIFNKVAIIEGKGFNNNTNLVKVLNTSNIEVLEDGSFTNCGIIDEIEFSNNLIHLTNKSFINTSFNNIVIKDNDDYKEEDGFVIYTPKNEIILAANNIPEKVVIKSHLDEVNDQMFNSPKIKDLTLNSVNVIKEGAFLNSSIESLEIVSVKEIERGIFSNNNAPKVLNIPFIGFKEDDLKDFSYLLRDPLYKQIEGLNDITITGQSHFDKTFKGFDNISKLTLLNVKHIEEETFYGCSRMRVYIKDVAMTKNFPKRWDRINDGVLNNKIRLRQLK